jgi:uncharacterized protein (DUF1697 family)
MQNFFAAAPLMVRHVALFRGINVGKAKRIAMADLRALLGKLGYTGVQTLLNSGNAVFTGDASSAARHADRIRQAVLKKTGVDALVIVKTDKDVAAIIAGNELGAIADNHSRLLVALTNDGKALAGLKALARAEWGDERIHVGKHAAYLWCANGILESKAATALLKGLEGSGTTRNWATLNKIHALMGEVD